MKKIKLPKDVHKSISKSVGSTYTIDEHLCVIDDNTYSVTATYIGSISGIKHDVTFTIKHVVTDARNEWTFDTRDYAYTPKGRLINSDELGVADYFIKALDGLIDFIEELEKR